MKYASTPLVHNETDQQFELTVQGQTALIAYRLRGGEVYLLDHTEVPEALEGQGVGSALVEKTLQWIEERGGKIIPTCPFVAAYLERHLSWKRLVA
jgi:predicted GNAT family acetyltransferase